MCSGVRHLVLENVLALSVEVMKGTDVTDRARCEGKVRCKSRKTGNDSQERDIDAM